MPLKPLSRDMNSITCFIVANFFLFSLLALPEYLCSLGPPGHGMGDDLGTGSKESINLCKILSNICTWRKGKANSSQLPAQFIKQNFSMLIIS